jgi:acyl-CoA reductase-like NAD-dependent aldehyde dehydrogenase
MWTAAHQASKPRGDLPVGTTNAPFLQPTVVTGVPSSSALWTEEIFAPIAPVVVVKDADEAVALANDTGYGPGQVHYPY